jgi:hypothetical protein
MDVRRGAFRRSRRQRAKQQLYSIIVFWMMLRLVWYHYRLPLLLDFYEGTWSILIVVLGKDWRSCAAVVIGIIYRAQA